MQVYLPVAEMPVDALVILAMGGGVGFLSGLFGVGGGFLLTPMLIFVGIPPEIAVGTQAVQLVATSLSGALAHARRRTLDERMALVMMAGGATGSLVGLALFILLEALGLIGFAIQLLYVVFLGVTGSLMLAESLSALSRRRAAPLPRRGTRHHLLHRLPLRMRFPRSKLYISALMPGAIGFLGGLLVALMGVGGGFILVPMMIYLIGMPTSLASGTSLAQVALVTALMTIGHSVATGTVDILLALLLIAGGVFGAQFGSQFGGRLRGEETRALLGLLVVSVALKMVADLVIQPAEPYSIEVAPQ